MIEELKGKAAHNTQIGQQNNTINNNNITIVQRLVCFGEESKVPHLSVEMLNDACSGVSKDDQVDGLLLGMIRSVMQDAASPHNATAYAVSDRSTKAQFLRRKEDGATEAMWKPQGEWLAKQEIGRWLQRRLNEIDRKAQTAEHQELITRAIDDWPRHHQRLTSGTRVMGLLAETREWMHGNCADRLTSSLKQDEIAVAAELEAKRHRSFREARSDHVTPEQVFELAAKYSDEDADSELWMRGLKLQRELYAAMEGDEVKNIVALKTETGEILISQGDGQWENKTAEWVMPKIMERVHLKLRESLDALVEDRTGAEVVELALSEPMQTTCMRGKKPLSWMRKYREELTY